jgi:broad specificity phosphatase PhoE
VGRVIFVRHAQASFFGARYDEVSPLGQRQARALGEHWATQGFGVDKVYVGPRRRHLQTAELVAASYQQRGQPWPQAVELPDLDEHQGLRVMQQHLGLGSDGEQAMHTLDPGEVHRGAAVRAFFGRYFEVMNQWARGAIEAPDIESWSDFRTRSLRALDFTCRGDGTAVAFTSGGLVSSAVGWLLGLDDSRVLELSAVLRNTAMTEVQWGGRRRRLVAFNAVPHLPGPGSATAV